MLPILMLSLSGVVFSIETGVMKRDGETVTLYMNDTMYPLRDYLWTFGRRSPLRAITVVTNGKVTRVNGTRFENRLHTHVETGSITISNLTVNDSGIFLAQILTETGTLMQRFNLTVQDNSVIPLYVLTGKNITIDTDVKELHEEHTVRWTQGPDFGGMQIAKWNKSGIFIEKSFKDILQLNPLTGSITIFKVTDNYAGYYCVMMLWAHDPHILRQYLVTVLEPVSRPHISTAQVNVTQDSYNDWDCYVNCLEKNAPYLVLHWYKGEKEIAQTSNANISTNLTLLLEVQDQDEVIYTCVATNRVSEETVTVNSTNLCPPHSTGQNKLWIIGVVAFAAVFVLVTVYLYKWCKRRNKEGEERNMQEDTPQLTEVSQESNETLEDEGLLTNS